MTPDPKWLEIIKASGWPTLGLTLAFGVVFYLIHINVVPTPPSGWMIVLAISFAVCGCLTFTAALRAATKFVKPAVWIAHWHRRARIVRDLKAYMPFMTSEEKAIIAYLLHHNQQTFTCAYDGGYANTLISREIVTHMVRPGQVFAQEDMPCAIAPDVWKVLDKNRAKFPYIPAPDGAHPWRVSWMLR